MGLAMGLGILIIDKEKVPLSEQLSDLYRCTPTPVLQRLGLLHLHETNNQRLKKVVWFKDRWGNFNPY